MWLSFFAIGKSQKPNQVFTNNLRVTIMAAGNAQIKFKKSFQNHEYIQIFICIRNVRFIKSEVLKVSKLYSVEKRKEYTQRQKNICRGVVRTKK
jgi:hypothetical protein